MTKTIIAINKDKNNNVFVFDNQRSIFLLDDLNDDCDVIISKDSNVINGLDLRKFHALIINEYGWQQRI